MDTKIWGPGGWTFLHTITFNYPMVIDNKNKEHTNFKKYTMDLFTNLQYTLPCKYCRQSYKSFIKKLPIHKYLNSRADITWWLYSIHNMVNEKLRKQEHAVFDKKVLKLTQLAKKEKWPQRKLENSYKKLEKDILFTGPDPTFEEVCHKYENIRAKCSATKGVKTCSSPRFRTKSLRKH